MGMPNPRAFIEGLHFKHGDTIIEPDRNRGVAFAPYDAAPTPSVNYRGLPFLLEAAEGGADALAVCVQTAADTYENRYLSLSASGSTSSTSALIFTVSGFGSEIADGIKGDLLVPFAHTITDYTILSPQSGSIQIDLWRDTYANFPPTDADSITASAPVAIDSSDHARDTTLTGWDTAGAAGDIYRLTVDSCTSLQHITLVLTIERVNV
jgi:hypothetical protein